MARPRSRERRLPRRTCSGDSSATRNRSTTPNERLLMLAATEPTLDIDALRAGIGAARFGPDGLDGLLTSGLVWVRENRLVFRHPLFRSAVRDRCLGRRTARGTSRCHGVPRSLGCRTARLAPGRGSRRQHGRGRGERLEVAAMGAAASGDRPAAAAMLQRRRGPLPGPATTKSADRWRRDASSRQRVTVRPQWQS